MLYCKSSGRRLLQHELARVACDSRDSLNMRLRESCATLVKFDKILPLVCVSVCVHDNSKNNSSIHLKLEHIVVYENSLDKFDIGHYPIKVKVQGVTLKFFSIYHNTNCQDLWHKLGSCD